MWVINTHIGISFLLYIAAIGIKTLCKKNLERYRLQKKKKVHFRRIKFSLFMFIPLVNVIMLLGMLYMILLDDDEAEKLMHRIEE